MKRVLLFCLAALIMGCASLTATLVTSKNRQNLSKLSVGMSRSTALAVMGQRPVTLRCPDAAGTRTREATVANPYRTEIIQAADKRLEVVYYAIDINDDCKISEDGLLPLVFEGRELIGWGKDFLDSTKNKASYIPELGQTPATLETVTPVETPVPVEIPVPKETPAPVEAPAPKETLTPVAKPAPVETPASVGTTVPREAKETAAPIETPAPKETPASVETIPPAVAATPKEASVPVETPAPKETPASVETPVSVGTTAPGEVLVPK